MFSVFCCWNILVVWNIFKTLKIYNIHEEKEKYPINIEFKINLFDVKSIFMIYVIFDISSKFLCNTLNENSGTSLEIQYFNTSLLCINITRLLHRCKYGKHYSCIINICL